MTADRVRVLVIEDNPGDARLVREALSEARSPEFDLEFAERLGTGARRLLEDPFDVVLLDLGLPDSQGIEGVAKLRADHPSVPIVVLTGLDDEALAQDAVKAGAQDFVVKGALPADLLTRSLRYAVARHKLLAELRESEERFRLLAQNARDIIYRYRVRPDAGFEYISPAATAITGYAPEDFYADPLFARKVIHADHVEAFEAFTRNPTAASLILRCVRKDGGDLWIEAHNVPILGSDGNVVAIEGIARDITERERLLGELNRANEGIAARLEKERLAAAKLRELDQLKNEFVGIVSHDIRSPLATIGGFAETMLGRWADLDDARKREFIEIIRRKVGELTDLVEDVLDVSRVESGSLDFVFAPFDLTALVRRVASETAAPSGRVCRVDAPDEILLAMGDERRQRQVLTNLISNAIKFSSKDAPVEISLRNKSALVEVGVRDHGMGIRAEDIPKLFQKFSRIRGPGGEQRSGTGLGLYICKSFVEAMGGTIRVESEPGRGSTFTYTVPVAHRSAEPA